jgi:O-antigen/teichoic acid export membrane protein
LFGRAVFGTYQASVAILEMLTRGGTGGADKAMLRYVAGHRARGETDLVRSALGTGLRMCLGISGILVVILEVSAGSVARLSREPALATALRLMAPAAVFTGCMWVLVQASLAAKITRANLIVRGLGEPLFLLTAGLVAAGFGRRVPQLATAYLVAALATLLLAVVTVGRIFGAGELRRALLAPRLPGFARFSLPFGGAEMLNAVVQRADVVLLTMFVGTSAAAVYAASEFITRVIANIRYAFDSVAAAMFSEALHLNQRERLRQNLVLITRWVASVAVPIAVVVLVLRHELLGLYGPGFQEGATALVVLALGQLVNATMGLPAWILLVSGRSRMLLVNNAIAAVVNVAVGLVLIPRFGLVGTAISALGTLTLFQIAVLIEVAVTQKVHPFHSSVAKPFLAGVVALLAARFAQNHLQSTMVRVPMVIGAGLGVYLIGLLALGLPGEDRRLLLALFNRIRGTRGK